MQYHRTISVLTLITFLPFAASCSSRQTIPLESDLEGGQLAVDDDAPLRIKAFTMRTGERRDWVGEVRAVSTDSLEFARELVQRSANAPPVRDARQEIVRFAKADVASVEIVEYHEGRSLVLVFVGLPAALFAIAFLNLLVNGYD